MRSISRARRALALAAVATLTTVLPAAAAAPVTAMAGWALVPELSVAAPAPGYGIAASAVLASGGHVDLILETDLEGITRRVVDAPAPIAPAAQAVGIAGGPGACSDSAYQLLSTKWKSPWKWSFQAGSTPNELTKAKAEISLKAAVRSITGARNGCDRPDTVNATATYLGRTTKKPGVSSGGGCLGSDGKSVVGFGNLPQNVLGLTCTVFQIMPGVDTSIESDVLFNKADFEWATSLASCHNEAMLRSIATHEFGHVFGLGHVSENRHGKLTMSTAIGPCDDSAFTLGLGDMLGLEQRY
ncbi:MAG: matrixin family metalloprotease [Chloroflexi bacterium]|nr:matrixin family metalloprotease [Chloroflexota bacterium]